jgi:hypothetical protein
MYNHEDVLKLLSPQDKAELALWEELIASKGFALLLQTLTAQHASAVHVIQNAPAWEVYHYQRGIRDGLETILNLESSVEFAVQDKLEAARNSDDAFEQAAEEFA